MYVLGFAEGSRGHTHWKSNGDQHTLILTIGYVSVEVAVLRCIKRGSGDYYVNQRSGKYHFHYSGYAHEISSSISPIPPLDTVTLSAEMRELLRNEIAQFLHQLIAKME